MTTCDNCHRTIGDLESPCRWNKHTVCRQCMGVLENEPKSTACGSTHHVGEAQTSNSAVTAAESSLRDGPGIADAPAVAVMQLATENSGGSGAVSRLATGPHSGACEPRKPHEIRAGLGLYAAAILTSASLYCLGVLSARHEIMKAKASMGYLLHPERYAERYPFGEALGVLAVGVLFCSITAALVGLDLRRLGWRMSWLDRFCFCSVIVMPCLCLVTRRVLEAFAGMTYGLLACFALVAVFFGAVAYALIPDMTPEPPRGRMVAVTLLGGVAFVAVFVGVAFSLLALLN